jgi:hypothetical protein
LITLYHGSGAQDFDILDDAFDDRQHEVLMLNARQLLRARGETLAAHYLERIPFRVVEGTNFFNDNFHLLIAWLPLTEYEEFRNTANQSHIRSAFRQIAEVLTEIGPYIRFIAIDLKRLSPKSWEVFICHASDDKENIVEPLYRHLESVGIRCWYDRGEVLWGDSIVGKINEGLRSSRFVIVVVSTTLLQKTWATKEMNAALGWEIDSGTTRVLPLIVGTDEEVRDITNHLVIQRDKRYVRWSGNPQEIEKELRALLRRENARGRS